MSSTFPTDQRSYFAANAPADVPDWFRPDNLEELLPMPAKPEVPASIAKQVKEMDLLGRGLEPWDLARVKPADVAMQYGRDLNDWEERKRPVMAQREQYRYFLWRWYYADQMINLRPALKAAKMVGQCQEAIPAL